MFRHMCMRFLQWGMELGIGREVSDSLELLHHLSHTHTRACVCVKAMGVGQEQTDTGGKSSFESRNFTFWDLQVCSFLPEGSPICRQLGATEAKVLITRGIR